MCPHIFYNRVRTLYINIDKCLIQRSIQYIKNTNLQYISNILSTLLVRRFVV